jgi:16S rRNA (uracil1498-N3)-methyltransferase
MSAPWFIASSEHWEDELIRLPEDESHHAVDVLRISPPDVVSVTDGRGRVARCAAARVEGGRLVAEILEMQEHRRLKPEVVVYQGASKGRKVDDGLDRLAELGVGELWVYQSERAVVSWDREKVERLQTRWRSIAKAATKRARSAFATEVGGALSWTELVRHLAKEPFAVVLWEEASLPMRTAFVDEAERIALVVGPEGGLTRAEAEALADVGGQLVSLGPRILRTENAPVVATTALLYHYRLIG